MTLIYVLLTGRDAVFMMNCKDFTAEVRMFFDRKISPYLRPTIGTNVETLRQI